MRLKIPKIVGSKCVLFFVVLRFLGLRLEHIAAESKQMKGEALIREIKQRRNESVCCAFISF